MKNNDLANLVVPRDVVVWEGLVGILPDPKVAVVEEKFRRKGRWEDAVACYEVNEMMARKVVDLTWRFNLQIDLLTHLGHHFALALEARMDRESMPFNRVYAAEANVLSRSLAITPDIRTIYTPIKDHQFTYGAKGRIIGPDDYNLLGAM